MVAAWLPGTHAAYYSKLKDQVDLVGPNVTGARLGWATPDYSPLTSIADLKAQGGMVENKVESRTIDGYISLDELDVSSALNFLVSEEARFITGVAFPVDAGALLA